MAMKAPRGTADILPQDAALWRYVEKTAAETARNFGYEEIRTPVFEHTELFQRGVGDTTDVVQKEMYTFNDKGDRSITLRPEGTASAARAYIEHSLHALPQPVKLYYCGACYRYEKPQAGRLREFHQFGIEAFGSTDPALDAEIIALGATIFKKLGCEGLQLNINSIGCPSCRKKYNEALTSYLSAHSETLCETCNTRLGKNPMRVLDCKSPVCKEVAAGAPAILDYICEDCRTHFEAVQGYLRAMNIPFEIDASIVRGLDYYTRTVFEFVSTQIGAQGTVCGGGRYDGLLAELGGNPGPGMGFAMGIERIILVLRAMGLVPEEKNPPRIFVASIGQTEAALSLCQKLREAGVYAVCDVAGRSLKAQMKNADREGAAFSLVLGEDEVRSGEAQLKNMETGEKETVSLSDIPALIDRI
ncbi:MAG: histidine--tRNA ligase [Clostridia bacterium]|nr:histidine--tRNA ligase [Clostridia bacterium]